jgi:hypothetical protein
VGATPTMTNHWCWNCGYHRNKERHTETFHKKTMFERIITSATMAMVKAFIFISIGYAWAVKAYGFLG